MSSRKISHETSNRVSRHQMRALDNVYGPTYQGYNHGYYEDRTLEQYSAKKSGHKHHKQREDDPWECASEEIEERERENRDRNRHGKGRRKTQDLGRDDLERGHTRGRSQENRDQAQNVVVFYEDDVPENADSRRSYANTLRDAGSQGTRKVTSHATSAPTHRSRGSRSYKTDEKLKAEGVHRSDVPDIAQPEACAQSQVATEVPVAELFECMPPIFYNDQCDEICIRIYEKLLAISWAPRYINVTELGPNFKASCWRDPIYRNAGSIQDAEITEDLDERFDTREEALKSLEENVEIWVLDEQRRIEREMKREK
ncbi:hypothetical protein BS50DRAFT_647564 [Corynespora cassiicola Philippines]|uniref:Uncharacterized protein n=1 Tax=Corynespora cassiicola Philippines TaxID=1448308 RepID=A0A2T2NEI5_CORCC|nr:hypothetical protein BS50DRAFT_647564 [Corynespora cassiicola Philippines]